MRLGATICMTAMIALLAGASPSALGAQQGVRQQATRAELQELERKLAPSGSDARLAEIRARLADGDFREGDRIDLRVIGEPTLTDSFLVRSGRMLVLPDLPTISLSGVLRSELEPYLKAEIGKTLRNAQVTATSFVRVAVLGGVLRPGFYQISAETPLTQAIMMAGGPAPSVPIEKTVVRRGSTGAQVLNAIQVRDALARGASLDQSNILPGDEIVLPAPRVGSGGLVPILGALAGVATALVVILR